ncbi:hypothetical protein ACQPZF_24635 [Actinosynnema sp. CS-041913]|uniref:hypothetical protein n=1 Tax=Actinosynnema sp. CS-041913 TaxID=3239917 RepID=UPI003D94B9FF
MRWTAWSRGWAVVALIRATSNSTRVGWVSYYEVWHHYSTSGNWSLGYDRRTDVAGYVPLGILAQDLGNGSTATLCPYH